MTPEYIAQMAPMWATAGLMVAWLAHAGWTANGHGFLIDMALGLGGGVLAGTLVRMALASDVGMLAMFTIGGGGAIVALVAQRAVWHPATPIVSMLESRGPE